VADTALYGNAIFDLTETIPALAWPDNITTYAAMRNDTQISGVLKAYTLPLRSANWMIDPKGCKPDVVKMCADAYGLPILGEPDSETGPFRRRGVLWDEHLDVALDMLIYGHMPFAIGGEVTGKPLQWRLNELSERLPSTIIRIDVESNGKLKSMTQFGADGVEIFASNLLWYVHGRRGGNWTGRSMLREAYAPWLLKHEMWRVLATSSRRFGTGIPVVNAPPGATDAQIELARQLASAMRVGDTSGIGLPEGYQAQIAAMTGSLPDTLSFVRYLDQQIAQAVLASVLNLDASPNGSRALGETMLQLLQMSWKAVATEIATPANRLLANMVDWNFGEDEAVPRIMVRDLNRPEPTFDAITALVTAGAIKYDPNLDAAMRDMYQLPPADQKYLDAQAAAADAATKAQQAIAQAKVNPPQGDAVPPGGDGAKSTAGSTGTPPPVPGDTASKAPKPAPTQTKTVPAGAGAK
jgi:hypothetical protein